MARDRKARHEAKALRLFVAVEVPEAAKAVAAEATAGLRGRFPEARWVPPENQHVTLAFLGQTWPRLEGWVRERIAEAAEGLAPFEVTLRGLGAFRAPSRARVVWVGLGDEPSGALTRAATYVQEALEPEFPRDRRPFSPHLTLARSDPPLALNDEDLAVPVPAIVWQVDRIVLFRSHLRRPAPRYEELQTFGFGLRA